MQNAAQARAYLGIASGITNYGGSFTNSQMYGTTLNGSTTNASLTASRVMVTDANKVESSSATTATEIGYVSGVTSAIQTQLNAKAATTTLAGYVTNLGGLTTNLSAAGLTVSAGSTNSFLTASSIVVTDANKGTASGTTTANLALLGSDQTFTGTPTFPAAVFSANNIGMRLLWSSPTNIYLASVATSATLALTNNGDFASCTYVGKATIPPLLGLNSAIVISLAIVRTNTSSSVGVLTFYAGANTNYVGYLNNVIATSVGHASFTLTEFLTSANSGSSQVQGNTLQNPVIYGITNFTDTTITNTLYFGAMTATGCTNAMIVGLKVHELYAP